MRVTGRGGLSIWVNEQGPADGTPVLLIQGLGMQATDWPPALLAELARHHRVVTFDHRDAGLSDLCGPAVDPDLTAEDFPTDAVPLSTPAYTLFDMAADALTVLDALEIASAHILGYSMGGMIAQILAAQSPARVRTLTSLMSSGGQAWIASTPAAWNAMARSIVAVDRDRRLEQMVEEAAVFRGPIVPLDLAEARSHAESSLARAYCPAGIWRQALAIRGSGDRATLLHAIRCPTLIVHGSADPCIAIDQARRAAALIPGASFETLDGIGHDFPASAVDRLNELLPRHFQ